VRREGGARRRLSGEPERCQEPPHRLRLGHRAHDPARARTARTDEDVNRDHPADKKGFEADTIRGTYT
jgi:hypothetical protein